MRSQKLHLNCGEHRPKPIGAKNVSPRKWLVRKGLVLRASDCHAASDRKSSEWQWFSPWSGGMPTSVRAAERCMHALWLPGFVGRCCGGVWASKSESASQATSLPPKN
eukprot:6178466-Pleurochrysis_carterae.AAC.1